MVGRRGAGPRNGGGRRRRRRRRIRRESRRKRNHRDGPDGCRENLAPPRNTL